MKVVTVISAKHVDEILTDWAQLTAIFISQSSSILHFVRLRVHVPIYINVHLKCKKVTRYESRLWLIAITLSSSALNDVLFSRLSDIVVLEHVLQCARLYDISNIHIFME